MIAKGGIVELEMEDTLKEMTLQVLRQANPEGERAFRETLEDIKTKARQRWPVRQPTKIERDDQGDPKRTKDGKVRFRKQTSQRSIDKFHVYAKVRSGLIEVGLENRAPYAWAMFMGLDTKGDRGKAIILPLRSRVSNELLVKPMKQNTKKVTDRYTEGLLEIQRKAHG
jgi:hypothetical protein